MANIERIFKEKNLKFKRNVPISGLCATKIGGIAKYLIACRNEEELIKAMESVKKGNISYLLIGGGSNLLVSDSFFNGVVILNKVKGLKKDGNFLYVKSGTLLSDLVFYSARKGLSGFEKLAGIPGTLGGAIYGNAGAYAKSISECLVRVKIFDGRRISWINKKDCGFSYRESIFKKTKPLILEVELKLKQKNKKQVAEKTLGTISDRVKKYKEGILCPGSFFKNVGIEKVDKKILTKIPKEKIIYGKIPAGYLLEEVGAKEMSEGKIRVSDTHANFLINEGNGKAKDFYDLAMKLKAKVKEKFGIELEPEVQIIGFGRQFKNLKVAILGLGMEGKDLVSLLSKEGAFITIYDRKEKKELDLTGIDKKNVKFILGKKYLKEDLSNFDIIFRSPGVYRYIREIVKAEKKGVEISSATKLFFEKCPAKIIGVTGTKGKGTTASLIYEILKASAKKVFLAGNIGKPFLQLLPDLDSQSWVVLELSSFQLIDLYISPHIAVVLNITEDHMDWHKDRKEYIQAKTNIVNYQNEEDYAVVNSDYIVPRNFDRLAGSHVYYFSCKKPVKGSFVENGRIFLNLNSRKELIGKTDKLLLRGEHNWENITAAICASALAGSTLRAIKRVISSFKGLEHRLELVREFKEVSFYNDSFATGPQPTIAAISSFGDPITLILGGYDKGLNYRDLAIEISRNKNLKTILLIGDLSEKLFDLIMDKDFAGKIVKLGKPSMEQIVEKAFKLTPKKGIVLFSPAAASFDMFKNYKERGLRFKEAVLSM